MYPITAGGTGGWQTHGDHLYKWDTRQVPWLEAYELCITEGAELALVINADIFNFLHNIVAPE